MEFTGEFETHLTVSLSEPDRIEMLRQWGAEHGLKCLHILLDRGETPSQPMLTRQRKSILSTELETARSIARSLGAEGFPVVRIKIEAAPWNLDIPQSDADAAGQPPDRHFEHHIKLLLPGDTDIASLVECAEKHTAHLSRNALRKREDGQHERFVTQRCYGVGQIEAKQRLNQLQDALAAFPYPILETEEEFVVYDSNLAVDAGWIHPQEG